MLIYNINNLGNNAVAPSIYKIDKKSVLKNIRRKPMKGVTSRGKKLFKKNSEYLKSLGLKLKK